MIPDLYWDTLEVMPVQSWTPNIFTEAAASMVASYTPACKYLCSWLFMLYVLTLHSLVSSALLICLVTYMAVRLGWIHQFLLIKSCSKNTNYIGEIVMMDCGVLIGIIVATTFSSEPVDIDILCEVCAFLVYICLIVKNLL